MADAEIDKVAVADRHGFVECYSSSFASDSTCCDSDSGEFSSSVTVVAANSITGMFSDIEQKYAIDSAIIGTGYQAHSVRECFDRATGRRYAVKSIHKCAPVVKMTDLHREVQLLKEVKHESIIQLVDVFEDTEYLHIVTDLYSGGELYDRIELRKKSSAGGAGCMAEDEAAGILRQVLAALSHLHDSGIVHRDLKPENIMFKTTEEDSLVKLIDFGLARKHYRESFEPYTSTIVGSSYFLSPEVLRKKYDSSCDIWSVGVIAFIMLCGYPPFNGANDREVCDAIRRCKLNFHRRYWKGVSKDAKEFIRGLLRENPRKRMSIEDAFNHPWMTKHNTVASEGKDHRGGKFFAGHMPKRLRTRGSVFSFGGNGLAKLRSSATRS